MRHCHGGRILGVVGVIVGLGLLAGQTLAQNAPKLRYGFQKDQEFVYDVKIVAELPDEEITRAGTITFKVYSATEGQFVLGSSGTLAHSSKGTGRSSSRWFGPPRIGPPRRPFGPFSEPSRPAGATFSRTGDMKIMGREDWLPFLLGEKDQLVVEPLSDEAKAKWDRQRDLGLVEQTDSGHGPFFRGFGPRSTHQTKRGAEERIDFAVLDSKGDVARISKQYSFTTIAEEGVTYIDMSGKGEFEFDLKQGLIASQAMKYQIKVNEKNATLTVPVTLKYRLLPEAEVAAMKKKAAEDAAAKAEVDKPKPFQPGEREKLLKDLRSGDDKAVQTAAKRLAKTVPDDNRAAISRALCNAMKGTNEWIQADLLAALEFWHTPDAETTVIEASKSKVFFVRGKATGLLGKFKTETAAEAAAAQMVADRHAAAAALKAMGPVAEPYVLPLLKDRDFFLRGDACGILSEIGGKKALKALKDEAQGLDFHNRRAFDSAIAAVEKRLARGADGPEAVAEKEPANRPAGKSAKAAAEKPRTWRDASGSYEIEATLISFDAAKATLRRTDGREVSVPIKKLSQADQDHLAERAKAKPENPFEQ